MSFVQAAYDFMVFAHGGDVDKQGQPYYLHTKRVGERAAHLGPEHEAVGYLHDTVEDVEGVTLETLREIGMPELVVQAVDAMTKRQDEKGTPGGYQRFIERCAKNPIAREVKKIDIADNMRPGGYESLYARYRKALAYLEGLDALN